MLRRGFLAGCTAWAAALPLATFLASQPHPAMPAYLFALAVYAVGAVVCHQLDARSFHLWAHQMPVCARCVGIYTGTAMGAVAAAVTAGLKARGTFQARLKPRGTRWIVGMAAVPLVLSVLYEWTTGVTPSNALRAATGVVFGAAVGGLVVAALDARRTRATL